MGYGSVHGCSCNRAGEGCTGNEHLDQVPRHRYSREHDNMDSFHSCLRNSGAKTWIFAGIRGSRAQIIPKSNFLASSACHPNTLPIKRFCMEIVSLDELFEDLTNISFSAKRMYYPQTYHHIQEIQKYNIQDYRPRYIYPTCPRY